jgi:hypothetical protein
MAIYKIFAEKDASLYSYYPSKSTGMDEILDLSTYHSSTDTYESSRIIIKFPQDEIVDVVANKVSGSSYSAFMKLYLANASELPIDYSIYTAPISGSWDIGTGRVSNVPETTDGVSWTFKKNAANPLPWPTSSLGSGLNNYYSGSNGGGGVWWGAYQSTQSFNNKTSKDIELDVSLPVAVYYAGNIANEGFIIRHDPSVEFISGSTFELKYFSIDTHTIYPPCLEIRWDNTTFITGSNSILNSDDLLITLGNNREIYKEDSIYRFRLGVRKQFPTRTFQTSSVYTNNFLLPATSYWSIKDYKTEDTIIDFDTNYTKIGCDGTSSYFDVYMNGMQPERYYRLVFKVVIGTRVLIFDDDYIFKIIR